MVNIRSHKQAIKKEVVRPLTVHQLDKGCISFLTSAHLSKNEE